MQKSQKGFKVTEKCMHACMHLTCDMRKNVNLQRKLSKSHASTSSIHDASHGQMGSDKTSACHQILDFHFKLTSQFAMLVCVGSIMAATQQVLSKLQCQVVKEVDVAADRASDTCCMKDFKSFKLLNPTFDRFQEDGSRLTPSQLMHAAYGDGRGFWPASLCKSEGTGCYFSLACHRHA